MEPGVTQNQLDNDVDSTQPWEGDLVVSSNGTAHAIWSDQEGGSNHKVKYAQRPSGGSWTSPVTISDPAHDASKLTLLINNNDQLYASWSSFGTVGFYARHQVGGNWAAIQRVDMNQPPLYPIMLMDSQQNVHYFWFFGSFPAEMIVYYRRQMADNTWGPVTPISNPHTDNTDLPPRLLATIDGQNIHVTWSVEKNLQHDMYYTENTGSSWSSPIQLNNTTESQYPQFLGASGGNIYIVGYNSDDQTHRYHFRPSTGSWTAEPMNFLGPNPKIIGIVSADNTLHLVWDNINNTLQYRSRSNLNPWSSIEPVGNNFGQGLNDTIKQTGVHLDMGWEDNGADSNYAHALIQTTNLPTPKLYSRPC